MNELTPGHHSTTQASLSEDGQPLGQVPTSAARQFSKRQLALAFAIAAIADAFGFFATPLPPIVWLVDFLTVILLFVVLGWHWALLPGLVMEAIPGASVLPLWLLVVGSLVVWGAVRPEGKMPRGAQRG